VLEWSTSDESGTHVSITINADDPRTIRAIELAAEADLWLKGRNRAGDDVYAVPSQSEQDRYYIVTRSSCDCPDFLRRTELQSLKLSPESMQQASPSGEQSACKHMLAVRLHSELVRAQQHQPPLRRREHLRIVSPD
jgi:hypothetical protein